MIVEMQNDLKFDETLFVFQANDRGIINDFDSIWEIDSCQQYAYK